MVFERYVAEAYHSNMYVIPINSAGDVIVVDPGDANTERLYNYLRSNNWYVRFVILTHEHFDHCAGVIFLRQYFDFTLLCTSACAELVATSKGNLSRYVPEYCPEFVIIEGIESIKDFQRLTIGNIACTFIETPGHSPGSMCILTDGGIFSGDTILASKTPLKLPGSNKIAWKDSVDKLRNLCGNRMLVYPGHGTPFYF